MDLKCYIKTFHFLHKGFSFVTTSLDCVESLVLHLSRLVTQCAPPFARIEQQRSTQSNVCSMWTIFKNKDKFTFMLIAVIGLISP